MVKRCIGQQCVDHPQECDCAFCLQAKGESVVVTEQGMFGELLSDYELDSDPTVKRTK